MIDIPLTNLDDNFESSDPNLGKIEGFQGDDRIVISGGLAQQIDGDQGNDDLRGAEVIYGGDGNDSIANAGIAYGMAGDDTFQNGVAEPYGGEGDDWFYMRSGGYADGGSASNAFYLEGAYSTSGDGDYAIIQPDSTSEISGALDGIDDISISIILGSAQQYFSADKMSRIFDSETNQPTTSLLLDLPFDYNVIVENFFASPTDDSPAISVYLNHDYSTDPDYTGYYLSDVLSDPNSSGLGEVYLPVDEILTIGQPDQPDQSENETLAGSDGDDHLEGFDGDDRLFGWGGDDRLEGDNGDDRLFGMEGDDVLFGGSGSNRLDGGSGDDRIHAVGDQDEVWGDAGSDVIFAGADETTVWFEEIGDDAAISETDIIHNFDLGQDKIMIEGQAFDPTAAAAFLAGNAMIDGEDLFIDLGDGRAIKVVDIVEDDDATADDFVGVFGDLGI